MRNTPLFLTACVTALAAASAAIGAPRPAKPTPPPKPAAIAAPVAALPTAAAAAAVSTAPISPAPEAASAQGSAVPQSERSAQETVGASDDGDDAKGAAAATPAPVVAEHPDLARVRDTIAAYRKGDLPGGDAIRKRVETPGAGAFLDWAAIGSAGVELASTA